METFSALPALCAGNSVPVNSPHKGQWRGALMFSLICVWIDGWVNNREAGDLSRHRGHYDVNVMILLTYYIVHRQPAYTETNKPIKRWLNLLKYLLHFDISNINCWWRFQVRRIWITCENWKENNRLIEGYMLLKCSLRMRHFRWSELESLAHLSSFVDCA